MSSIPLRLYSNLFIGILVNGGDGGENGFPTDLPLSASDSNDEANGALIGGIIAGLIVLGLAILAAVLLARRYGCCCCCCVTPVAAGTAGAAAAAGSAGVYEAPLPFKKGVAENDYNPKGPGYTDLAFDNNAYATEADMYLRPPPEAPPAYCEAEPVYGNVEPPVYDNIEYSGGKPVVPPVPSKAPSVYPNIHTEYEGAYEEPVEQEMIQSQPAKMAFSNNGYGKKLPTGDDIILAKNGLKPTGAKLP